MATRRKRPVPEGWATVEEIESFTETPHPEAALPGSKALALASTGDLALFGGNDGVAIVYSISKQSIVRNIKVGSGAVTAAAWWEDRPVIASSNGTVTVFDESGNEVASFSVHAGSANGLALHPSGDILASVGSDKSYVLYDLTTLTQVTRVFTDSGMSHVERYDRVLQLTNDNQNLRMPNSIPTATSSPSAAHPQPSTSTTSNPPYPQQHSSSPVP